jgi:predicted nucleic acid-binding protein
MDRPHLLDTNILLHWVRGSRQSEVIERQCKLSNSQFRPLICEVSLGEMRTFARSVKWGPEKIERLRRVEQQLAVVDISDPRVLDGYAELSTMAKQSGLAIFNAKNDLWIAAAALATRSHLLTMDRDFLPLRNRADFVVTILDAGSGLPLP